MEPLRVVVIDDEANTCTFLKAVFEAEGHGCHTFLRAEEAEQYVANNEVDLVMVDVYLGALNGIDLLQRLRALRPNAYPIIMTANVSVERIAWRGVKLAVRASWSSSAAARNRASMWTACSM